MVSKQKQGEKLKFMYWKLSRFRWKDFLYPMKSYELWILKKKKKFMKKMEWSSLDFSEKIA